MCIFTRILKIIVYLTHTRTSRPEELIKKIELKVNHLLEESTFAAEKGDFALALDKVCVHVCVHSPFHFPAAGP